MKKNIKQSFWDSLFEPTPKQVKRIQKVVGLVGFTGTIVSKYPSLHTPDSVTAVLGILTGVFVYYLQTFTND